MKRSEKQRILRQEIGGLLARLSFIDLDERYLRDEYDVLVSLKDEEGRDLMSFFVDQVEWDVVPVDRVVDIEGTLGVDRTDDTMVAAATISRPVNWTPLRNRRF